jgi:hypothetical protein
MIRLHGFLIIREGGLNVLRAKATLPRPQFFDRRLVDETRVFVSNPAPVRRVLDLSSYLTIDHKSKQLHAAGPRDLVLL